jgi:glycosyltransferase involved in cell wall biosynthesis
VAVDAGRLRVAMVSFSGYPDQGATYFYEMSQSLARLGHDVTAVAAGRGHEPAEATEEGVRVIRVPMPLTVKWASPARWTRKLRFLMRAAALIRHEGFDVVHVYCTLGACVVPIRARGRAAIWIQEHQTGAVSSSSAWLRWLENRLRAWQGLAFDANFTVTQVLGERLFGRRPFDVVPAGVNLRRFASAATRDVRAELGISASDIVFVHAGVLEAERGTDVPVRAFARAFAQRQDLWLLMPGKGAQLEELRRLAASSGVASRVWLPGYVPYEEMPRLFAAADAGVSYLPRVRYYEGQPPMKVMEYMGAGLPVVATDVASHRMLIEHGRNGVLAEPEEVAFSKAMLRVAADARLRRELSDRAKQSVALLTYDRVAGDRVIPAYRRLMAGRARG